MENGAVKNRCTYGSINRLEKAVDKRGVPSLYEYSGLGHRTGKTEGETEIHYTVDLTRAYHNLLQKEEEGNTQTFYWDGNVTAMTQSREKGIKTPETSAPCRTTKESMRAEEYNITPVFHYYLQDELGSPVRVSGYDTGNTGMMGVNGMTDGTTDATPNPYLTYGYDEFGNDLYDDLEEAGIPNPYSRHGEGQPFGYTGYQPDRIAGTCYAQAREYMPQNGRFGAVDKVKGNIMVPETLNEYGYCLGNPMALVDRDGKTPNYPAIDTGGFKLLDKEQIYKDKGLDKPIYELKRLIYPKEEIYREKAKEMGFSDTFTPYWYWNENSYGHVNSDAGESKNGEVFILGYSVTGGIFIYGNVGIQLVFDKENNIDLQLTYGGGMMVGAGLTQSVSIGRLRVNNVEDSRGLGAECGGGAGEGFIVGVDCITAYNNEGYIVGDGEMIYLGTGAEAIVVDAHEGVSNARSLIELLEKHKAALVPCCGINE